MSLRNVTVFLFFLVLSNAVYYDYFTSRPLSQSMLNYYNSTGRLSNCAIDVKPCNASERRRVDGSCNSLKYPSKGTYHQPYVRLLPTVFYKGSYARKSISGNDLVLPRKARVTLLCEGTSNNMELTQAVPNFGIFHVGDAVTPHNINFFLKEITNCCGSQRNDYMCTPNIIPEDDPIHRFSGISCMNMTRPITYQYLGCTNESIPEVTEEANPAFDLSQIYNMYNYNGIPVRAFVHGLLAVEIENGIIWPPNGSHLCYANNPGERCFKYHSNALLSTQMYTTWFMRQHNMFAKQLAKFNPCWDDETLYQVARDINIAFSQQMRIYEWMMCLMGKKQLLKHGIIYDSNGFRDIYDSNLYPAITAELSYSFRWFHSLQHGITKMYDSDGTFLKGYPVVNSTLRTSFLTKGKNIFYLTQGEFRSPAAKGQYNIHYDASIFCDDNFVYFKLAEMGLPYVQAATDIPTSDLHKGRLLGVRPYVDYVHFCFGYNITSFQQLEILMERDRILLLQELYENVRDVDLLAGLWSENFVKGGRIPHTLSCILGISTLRTIKGDRHWYERPNRPYAFTSDQLKEIRKSSLALLLCNVGDGVTEIQRHAMFNICPKNPLVSCKHIPKINISKWTDGNCKFAKTCN